MKYYIIAGEASGDLHGANMINALRSIDKEAKIRAWGGELMSDAGAEVVKHYRDLAFMGFWEVLKNLGTIRKNFDFCKNDIASFDPDTVVFIDYPGFNLRMAKWAKESGYSTQYYISPTIWAWNTARVHKIKTYVDQMFTILPFENKVYEKYGYSAQYVGHPLLDAIEGETFTNISKAKGKATVALLPGSRTQELNKILPVFAALVKQNAQYHYICAAVQWQNKSIYKEHFGDQFYNIQFETSNTYDVLNSADFAVVTSGTATLETALFGVPQVVVYKTSALTFFLAKRFAKVKYISLPNLILDHGFLKELIQSDCKVDKISVALKNLETTETSNQIKSKYKILKEKLGDAGASLNVAKAIYDFIK